MLVMAGCASQTEQQVQLTPPKREFVALKDVPLTSSPLFGIYDPFEKFNRSMYNFNARFDRYVFLPVVHRYDAITPNIVQAGVHNFFNNLDEVYNLMNNLLQGELRDSGATLGRFVINSTIGVLGLWDPATKMGIYERKEDFGQTLGRWGVGPGPYLVLPIFGPSTLRDTGGLLVDYAAESSFEHAVLEDSPSEDEVRLGMNTLEAIDERRHTSFRYYETGSPFEYTLVRYAYERMRRVQIEK